MLKKLKGKKINLRPIKYSDIPSIERHANDSEVVRFLQNSLPLTMDDSRKWVRNIQSSNRAKKTILYGIEDKTSISIVGMIGIREINLEVKSSKIGFWLGKNFWRRGYTYEAIQLMLKYAFDEIKLYRIYAAVHEPNTSSVELLKKVGFINEGKSREAAIIDGCRCNVLWFSILRPEFNISE